MINFENATKTYNSKNESTAALDHVSFHINKGELVGLIGPNGAGKSTLMKLICGILQPSEGVVSVLNQNPAKNRKKIVREIGAMFGNRSSLWFNIPAIESVYLMRDIYNIPSTIFEDRLSSYSKTLAIEDLLQKPVREMSLGQRIRVELLVTLIHQPKLLILDEPTLGLDIVSKNHFRAMLMELAQEKKTTIILTTHDIQDIEKVCDRIILINKGKKILDEKRPAFQNLISQRSVIQVRRDNEKILGLHSMRESNADWLKYVVNKSDQSDLIAKLVKLGVEFKVSNPDLEDFLYDFY